MNLKEISDNKKELGRKVEKELGKKPFIFSSTSNEGIEDLVTALFTQCLNNDK